MPIKYKLLDDKLTIKYRLLDDEIHRGLKSQTPADVRLFNRRTSAGELCRSNQLFTAHLLGGDKFSYQLNSCTSTRFRFNKELNYKLAALEVFLPNRNAFVFVASLKIHCRDFEKSDFTHFLLGNFPGGVLKEFLGGDVPLGPWNP